MTPIVQLHFNEINQNSIGSIMAAHDSKQGYIQHLALNTTDLAADNSTKYLLLEQTHRIVIVTIPGNKIFYVSINFA